MRTRGTFAAARAGSMTVARKSKRRGHFLGFLAVAAFPSELSTRAYARSPSSPRSVTSVAFSSSPIMDLTGYRQSETTEPSSFCAAFDMLHLSRLLNSGLASQVRDAERYAQRCAPCRAIHSKIAVRALLSRVMLCIVTAPTEKRDEVPSPQSNSQAE